MAMDGGMSAGAGSLTTDVTGTRIATYVQENGMMRAPADLTGMRIAALLPDGHGGFSTLTGQGNADGTFVIPGVPAQTYYLQFGDPSAHDYIITSSRVLDFGESILGRADVQPANQATTTFSPAITGLAPWDPNDHVELFAPNADTYAYDLTDANNPPMTAATSVNAAKLSYQDYFDSANLIDGRQGDQTYVFQLVSQMSPSIGQYNGLGKFAATSMIGITDGVDNPIVANLADAPRANFAAHLAIAQFENAATAGHPAAAIIDNGFYLMAQPGGLGYGYFGNSAQLLEYWPAIGSSDMDSGMLSYGNPFPSSWGVYGTFETRFAVSYSIPGAAMPVVVHGGIVYAADLNMLSSSGAAPPVGPVQNLQVNGMPASGPLTGVTPTPTITFTRPSIGTAHSYLVRIRAVTMAVGMAPQTQDVASFTTQGTSVTVPAGILTAGNYYVIRVTAIFSPRDSFDAPDRGHFPYGTADALSGLIQP
jgi:hypothetical protein